MDKLDKAKLHKKWRVIAQELSDLRLKPTDLDPYLTSKPVLAKVLRDKNEIGLGDLVLLRQFDKAIETADTRSAEFIRDTMGENPKQVVEVQKNPLSEMTTEELVELLSKLDRTNADG